MLVSKLTITKETKEKNKMSVREKGKVMFARLQELEEDGTLSKAKNRADVARLVGYPEERAKAGYAWVSNLIRRGHLNETIREWSPSGKMVAEYHTTGSLPDYGYEEVRRRKTKKEKIASEWKEWQAKEAEKQSQQWLEAPVITEPTPKTTIKYGKVEIETFNSLSYVVELARKLNEE